ncbi:MAG: DUF2069 domain-containing protein [Pseudomonadota bacterium]
MNRHTLLLAGSVLLLLLFSLILWLNPAGSIGLWLMQVLPLLLTVPGQYRRQPRSLQWLGFLLLFYLLGGILQAFNPLPILRMLGFCLTALAFLMFVVLLTLMKSRKPQSSTES